jgi:hypothetical protein
VVLNLCIASLTKTPSTLTYANVRRNKFWNMAHRGICGLNKQIDKLMLFTEFNGKDIGEINELIVVIVFASVSSDNLYHLL